MQTGINSMVIVAIMVLFGEPVRPKHKRPVPSRRITKKQARKAAGRKPKQKEVT